MSLVWLLGKQISVPVVLFEWIPLIVTETFEDKPAEDNFDVSDMRTSGVKLSDFSEYESKGNQSKNKKATKVGPLFFICAFCF